MSGVASLFSRMDESDIDSIENSAFEDERHPDSITETDTDEEEVFGSGSSEDGVPGDSGSTTPKRNVKRNRCNSEDSLESFDFKKHRFFNFKNKLAAGRAIFLQSKHQEIAEYNTLTETLYGNNSEYIRNKVFTNVARLHNYETCNYKVSSSTDEARMQGIRKSVLAKVANRCRWPRDEFKSIYCNEVLCSENIGELDNSTNFNSFCAKTLPLECPLKEYIFSSIPIHRFFAEGGLDPDVILTSEVPERQNFPAETSNDAVDHRLKSYFALIGLSLEETASMKLIYKHASLVRDVQNIAKWIHSKPPNLNRKSTPETMIANRLSSIRHLIRIMELPVLSDYETNFIETYVPEIIMSTPNPIKLKKTMTDSAELWSNYITTNNFRLQKSFFASIKIAESKMTSIEYLRANQRKIRDVKNISKWLDVGSLSATGANSEIRIRNLQQLFKLLRFPKLTDSEVSALVDRMNYVASKRAEALEKFSLSEVLELTRFSRTNAFTVLRGFFLDLGIPKEDTASGLTILPYAKLIRDVKIVANWLHTTKPASTTFKFYLNRIQNLYLKLNLPKLSLEERNAVLNNALGWLGMTSEMKEGSSQDNEDEYTNSGTVSSENTPLCSESELSKEQCLHLEDKSSQNTFELFINGPIHSFLEFLGIAREEWTIEMLRIHAARMQDSENICNWLKSQYKSNQYLLLYYMRLLERLFQEIKVIELDKHSLAGIFSALSLVSASSLIVHERKIQTRSRSKSINDMVIDAENLEKKENSQGDRREAIYNTIASELNSLFERLQSSDSNWLDLLARMEGSNTTNIPRSVVDRAYMRMQNELFNSSQISRHITIPTKLKKNSKIERGIVEIDYGDSEVSVNESLSDNEDAPKE